MCESCVGWSLAVVVVVVMDCNEFEEEEDDAVTTAASTWSIKELSLITMVSLSTNQQTIRFDDSVVNESVGSLENTQS